MKYIFLGIDSSTQGCKLVCINPTEESIEYVDSLDFDKELPSYHTKNGVIPSSDPHVSEADPNMWIEGLNLLFKRMKDSRFPMDRIKAISVSGQQHGLVALDSKGNLTRKTSKLWNDYSTSRECDILTEKIGSLDLMVREIGNSMRPGYTASKIYHFYLTDPDAASKTSTFFLVHNFINWYLTGGKKNGIRVMEPGDTSGMALRHPGKNSWSKKICDIISADLIDKLPPVKPSDQMIGKISQELVCQYGFSQDCLIDAGSGDNMYSAVGTGNITPNIVTISLGTSGTAFSIFDQCYVDPSGEIASFCDSTGKFLALLCVSNMANGYNQILDHYKISHDEFNTILNQTQPGNGGKLLFPWYVGERTPNLPFAVPVYWGFALNEFDKPTICRAVLEGHILNLYDGFRRMPIEPSEIRLTGGLSKSGAWCQTIADIFGTKTIPVVGEGAALGAAIHAAWAYLKNEEPEYDLKTLTDVFVKFDNSKAKNPRNKDLYIPLKEAFHELSKRLRLENSEVDPFKIFAKFLSDHSSN